MKEITTWPNSSWESVRVLGEGGYGKVYEIQRNEFGKVYKSAMKVMHIPAGENEIEEAFAEGMTREEVQSYFQSIAMEIISEFALMFDLRGHTNIVSYEDHMVLQHENGIGCDILIRMELLTPLKQYVRTHPCGDADIIKMGIDICTALELCRERGIVHRDIKAENIFVSDRGDYNLGDFGIARRVTEAVSVMSRKGTYMYMAPEVYLGKPYGMSVDLYSLGMVLYRYMNMGRAPFFPMEGPITAKDKTEAFERRMMGEPLPMPRFGMMELKNVVMKALAYKPEDRFANAEEFKDALIWCRRVLERRRATVTGEVTDSAARTVGGGSRVIQPTVNPAVPVSQTAGHAVHTRTESDVKTQAAAADDKTEAYRTERSTQIPVPDSEGRRKRALKIPESMKGPVHTEQRPKMEEPEKKADPGVMKCRYWPEQADLYNHADCGAFPVFGNPEYLRREIGRIRVVPSLAGAEKDAWDVSAAGDRSVLCWTEPEENGRRILYIGAEGKVQLEEDCSGLFAWFEQARAIELKDGADLTKVICMEEMFRGCRHLEVLDLSGADMSRVQSMAGLLRDCSHLVSLDLRDARTPALERADFLCCGCMKLEKADLSGWDTRALLHMEYMFAGCEGLQELSLQGLDTARAEHMENLFSGCRGLWKLDLTDVRTDSVRHFENMFEDCESLELLDIASFRTSNAVDMSRMFSGCFNLQRLNLSGFDTSGVVRMSAMFKGCEGLTELVVRSFDTRKVTSMEDMFRDCRSLKKLNVGRFETGNVLYMGGMFRNCEKLQQLNVIGFDTRKAWDMSAMFSGCTSLSYLDLGGFMTGSVEYMDEMFENCRSLPSLDLSGFDMSKVKSHVRMTAGVRI